MKLLRVEIQSAPSCGGLLDGLSISFRSPFDVEYADFSPLCLVGPNGAGKSQFLQVIAEIFQSLIHAVAPQEERVDGNDSLMFEIEYLINPSWANEPLRIKASRSIPTSESESKRRRKSVVTLYQRLDGEWEEMALDAQGVRELLPTKAIGYTSGANETLSLPFLLSRSAYALDVGQRALDEVSIDYEIDDTALMLIDYGTHLEVLVSNLLLGTPEVCESLLEEARLSALHSFRCVIQLAHSAAPKVPSSKKQIASRPGIQLTQELEAYIDQLRRCSTCHWHDAKTDSYTFDFFRESR
jgi:energy-coupling factor transporter ATP-binding protein EcfA2